MQNRYFSWNHKLRLFITNLFIIFIFSLININIKCDVRDYYKNKASLKIKSDTLYYNNKLETLECSGSVFLNHKHNYIESDFIKYDKKNETVIAKGNVKVFTGNEVFLSEKVFYNLKTEKFETDFIKSSLENIFYKSKNIIKPDKGSKEPIVVNDAFFSLEDRDDPNYGVKIKKLRVYPDDKIIAKDMKFYYKDIPFFWLPYLYQPLNDEIGYYPVAGWNSSWGGFILNKYGFGIGDDILGQSSIDYRSKRGLGFGFKLNKKELKDNPNIRGLNFYYTKDSNSTIRFNGSNRNENINSNRYVFNFQHRLSFDYFNLERNFNIDFNINKLSDEYVEEDFFPSHFKIAPIPDNFINLNYNFQQGEISLLNRFQLNKFFQTDIRSPELSIDLIRAPIKNTGIFYSGSSSFGRVGEEYKEPNNILDKRFNRFYSHIEFSKPIKKFNFLNFVPKVGFGYSNYSDFKDPEIRDFDRPFYNLGMDVSFNASRKYSKFKNKKFGLDGLMHVVRPYLNYSYLSVNGNIDSNFQGVDKLTSTTSLRSIDVPLFTSIDFLNDWNIFRFGVSNSWYTKRNGYSHKWLNLDNYVEYRLKGLENNNELSNFFTKLEWYPLPWLSLSSSSQVPINDDSDFSEVISNISFMPNDRFEFKLGHYYLNNHSLFDDSDLYTLSTYTKLGEQWGVETVHRFQNFDNILEYQKYNLYRDYGNWAVSLGAVIRDNRNYKKDYGVLLQFTLKSLPKMVIPFNFEPGNLRKEN